MLSKLHPMTMMESPVDIPGYSYAVLVWDSELVELLRREYFTILKLRVYIYMWLAKDMRFVLVEEHSQVKFSLHTN